MFRLAVVGVCIGVGFSARAEARRPDVPFARLFDTKTPSIIPLKPGAIYRRAGWAAVPEGDVAHTLAGDAVVLNDRLIVVFRKGGPGVEVYAWTKAGPKYRVSLALSSAAKDAWPHAASIRILENSPAAVALEMTHKTRRGRSKPVDGPPFVATYRLATGNRMTLEVRPGKGARSLWVETRAPYVVVPDFFGDDLVYHLGTFRRPRPTSFARPTVPLPAENFFLHLLPGGDGLLMCLWPSRKQTARVLPIADNGRLAAIGEIDCEAGKSIWIAVLQHPGIWHSRTLEAGDLERDIPLAWRPPFAAKWRASFASGGALAQSRAFAATKGEGPGRCWLDGERAVVRAPRPDDPKARGEATEMVVYPIDRSVATPLNVFCPIDVMRNTLGVGPCQYLLDAEGIAGAATPAQVAEWVERLFKRRRAGRRADDIQERLGQMTAHVEHVQKAIRRYARFASRAKALCAQRAAGRVGTAADVLAIADGLARLIASQHTEDLGPKRARQLAAAIASLIGRKDALAACQKLGEQLRAIDAAQYQALARGRMAARRIRQLCLMASLADPHDAELARKLRTLAEEMLWRK